MQLLQQAKFPSTQRSNRGKTRPNPVEGSRVVVVIPSVRIPRNLYCEVDEGNPNSDKLTSDLEDDIDFRHRNPQWKPRKTVICPGYGDDD